MTVEYPASECRRWPLKEVPAGSFVEYGRESTPGLVGWDNQRKLKVVVSFDRGTLHVVDVGLDLTPDTEVFVREAVVKVLGGD